MADNICDYYSTFQTVIFYIGVLLFFRDVMMREILNLLGDYAE